MEPGAGSWLEQIQIPGMGSVLNTWFAAEGDAGVMFYDQAFVTLGGYEIKLPVDIVVSAKRDIQSRTNQGGSDAVKSISRAVTMTITLKGFAGTWRKTTLPTLPNIPLIGGLTGELTGIAGTVIGTSKLVERNEMMGELFGIFRKADHPLEIKDRAGFLAALGVYAVVVDGFEASPKHPQYEWSMTMSWDDDQSAAQKMFKEDGQEEEPNG